MATNRKKWLVNAGIVFALILGLVLWILSPWWLILVYVVLLAMWLLLTRNGRLSLAAAKMGMASLPQRWGASAVVVVGIAGVVGVLVAMLAMAQGFGATVQQTGSQGTAIMLRGGSQAETNSVITRDQATLITSLPGIAMGADGHPLVSPELTQVVNLRKQGDGLDANALIRGVGPAAWTIRPGLKLIKGRKFETGKRELVVGQGAKNQYRGLEIGSVQRFANQDWTVVGEFMSGDANDSELWADAQTLASTYNRNAYQTVMAKLQGKSGLKELKAALADDPRLKLDAMTTADYYGKQSSNTSKFISILGKFIGAIMAIGAVFGALNSMYAAVAGRAREIATLRAIGFQGGPVVLAVMLETMLLALIGGVLGALIAWLLFNNYQVATMGGNFSQIMFAFKVTPELMIGGLKWALAIGLIGGLFPALRAARMPVTDALRSL